MRRSSSVPTALLPGLDSLAGSTSYNIYKNGSPATAADLKRYDVATYASATNSIIISDTRVSTYYEDCKPSPSNPATITVLGGKELNVLPTAADSLSKLKPGKQIVLLLTADGQGGRCRGANNTGARASMAWCPKRMMCSWSAAVRC